MVTTDLPLLRHSIKSEQRVTRSETIWVRPHRKQPRESAETTANKGPRMNFRDAQLKDPVPLISLSFDLDSNVNNES
jgi:hypothetical protein